jgi:hypothetical protein
MLYYTMCFFASEEVRNVLILVVLDDALVIATVENVPLNLESQSLLCWTML